MKYSNNIDRLSDDKQIQEIYLYIKNNILSKGEIVELGTFLGKVTKTILDAVPKKFDGRIYTYDNFVWNFNHNRKFPHLGLAKNQNFLDYVKKKLIIINRSVYLFCQLYIYTKIKIILNHTDIYYSKTFMFKKNIF